MKESNRVPFSTIQQPPDLNESRENRLTGREDIVCRHLV